MLESEACSLIRKSGSDEVKRSPRKNNIDSKTRLVFAAARIRYVLGCIKRAIFLKRRFVNLLLLL
ncbi:hypothetical protein D3C85_1823080 [compost metagenome]